MSGVLGGRAGGHWQPEPSITCVDCGGVAYLTSYLDSEVALAPGDIVAYRCKDCLDCWYLEVPQEAGGGFDRDVDG